MFNWLTTAIRDAVVKGFCEAMTLISGQEVTPETLERRRLEHTPAEPVTPARRGKR